MIRIYSIQARLCFIIEYGSPAPASASGGRGASAGADGRCAIDPAEDMLCLLYVAEQQWLLIERCDLLSAAGERAAHSRKSPRAQKGLTLLLYPDVRMGRIRHSAYEGGRGRNN